MTEPISEEEIFKLIKKIYSDPSILESNNDALPTKVSDSVRTGWVKVENNKIFHDIGDGSKPVLIRACEPVQLRINGKQITQQVKLESGDNIEWEIVDKPMYKLQVSNSKMHVYFNLLALERYNWNLINKAESQNLVVEAEEDKNMVLQTVNFPDVLLEVGKMSIVKNLLPTVIYEELKSPTYLPVEIAYGIEPTPSQDARLELFFNETIEKHNYEDIGGIIDFRNHLRIPSAKIGDVIARKIPLIEGTYGYDVYGSIVEPVTPKDIIIIAKNNVTINAEGEVIAQKEGRPRITGQKVKYFDINPAYIVTGDVDLNTGNIVFSGDVIVYGNVLDNMIIESLGNVYIMGNTYRSTITATGSIIIKGNVVGCYLYSGYFGVIFNRLYLNAKKLSEMLLKLIDASKILITILEAKGKNVSYGQILMILVESKFNNLTRTVMDIMTSITNMQNIKAEAMGEFQAKIIAFASPLNINKIESINYVLGIQHMIDELILSIESSQEGKVLIELFQCHLSSLKSNGDVLIRKDGVLQSNVYAKGNIIFYGNDSVCRGSQLEAEGSISAMQVGGETGGESILKAGKRIMVNRMNIGKVCIGKYCKIIDRPLENIIISYKDKMLVFENNSQEPNRR